MKVPMHWLRELVDIDVPTQELADRLSHSGSAVEAIERFAPGVSGVVVGRVITMEDVPESDKLCIAQVDVGGDTATVLAGAKNFKAGDLVALARPGARVTTIDGPLTERKMVGGKYTSQGMLCSAKELGIGDDHSGILVLDPDMPVGADVAELLGLDDDVLEFEIYPNRPDQMSVLGIAREVALLYGKELRRPDAEVVEDGGKASEATSVEIEDPEGCPRYLARVIEGVTFGPSPALVRARLAACGVRPLGNLVDATNYVLLLTGQPLHAFDLDKLAEQRIVVRRARSGEKLRTLDGEERALDPEDLVIADAQNAQALAGVMGGGESEVGETTTRVLLESAHFAGVRISRTSRRHHMRTEASARFERGSDPEIVPDAAAIAADLMRRWAGGVVAKGAVDEGGPPERRHLTLRLGRIRTVLGIEVDADVAVGLLTGLGCEVRAWDDRLDVVVPAWRPDLEREVDLIEEIARLHGYETIPAELKVGTRGGRSEAQVLRERVRSAMIGAGLSEATLSTFVARSDIEAIGYDGDLVRVANPMTEDQRQLRPSLFPGLLRAAERNVAYGVSSVRLFEFGKIFRGWPRGAPLPDETEHVAFVLVGNLDDHWSQDERPPDAFDASGVIDLALREIGIVSYELSTDDIAPLFHPGRSSNVTVEGEMVGRFGELRPSVARAFGLESPVVVGGLSLGPLFARAPKDLVVRALPTQPPVLRHISMWLPEGVAVADVIGAIEAAGGEHLETVDVLDLYEADDRRSVAFGLVFRAADRTLRAEEADGAREAIAQAAVHLGAEIR